MDRMTLNKIIEDFLVKGHFVRILKKDYTVFIPKSNIQSIEASGYQLEIENSTDTHTFNLKSLDIVLGNDNNLYIQSK